MKDEIWHLVQLNDQKGFELLFKRYFTMLCKYAYGFLKSEDVAEEIVQETFADIWEKRGLLNINVSIKSYLFRSVHNRCITYLKKNFKSIEVDYNSLSENFMPDVNNEDQFDDYFYEGIEQDLQNAIQSLPEQCRVIFRMCRFESMQYQEIADHLNISVNTVKTQLHRALEKLRKSIVNRNNRI